MLCYVISVDGCGITPSPALYCFKNDFVSPVEVAFVRKIFKYVLENNQRIRALRRLHSGGSGALVNFGRRRRRGVEWLAQFSNGAYLFKTFLSKEHIL